MIYDRDLRRKSVNYTRAWNGFFFTPEWSVNQCYSINCGVLCDAHGILNHVETNWPGSVHNSHVLCNCAVHESYLFL